MTLTLNSDRAKLYELLECSVLMCFFVGPTSKFDNYCQFLLLLAIIFFTVISQRQLYLS